MLRAIDKYSGGVFNPDDVRILVAAFDGAWRSLLASGITFESDRESKAGHAREAHHRTGPLWRT
jgi:aspartate oxidase